MKPPPDLPFRPDRRLFPFRSRWLECAAGSLHYVDEGSGPPILFLHGNPTWCFLYRGVVLRLRDAFRCVAVDLPGFGLSARPGEGYGHTPAEHAAAVGELVDALELDALTVVGHDWGGPVGMRVALDRPERIRALAMANTWCWPAEALRLRAFSAALSTGPAQGWMRRRGVPVRWVLRLGTKSAPPPEVLEQYRGPLADPGSRAAVAELPRQIVRAGPWLARIAARAPEVLGDRPLLLPWGVRDFAFPLRFADRFRRDFPRARLVRLDARHFVPEDAPGELAAALRAFLAA